MKDELVLQAESITAFDLLSYVCELVLEEPKRLSMGFVCHLKDVRESRGQDTSYFPRCGAVGCIAGWTLILTGHAMDERGGNAWPMMNKARDLLGLTELQAGELFRPEALMMEGLQQTEGHARRTVSHVRNFQREYLYQLKDTRVRIHHGESVHLG